jgi:hypothetical protein
MATKETVLTEKEQHLKLREKYLPNKEVFLKPIPNKDLTLIKKDKNFSAHRFMYDGAKIERWLPMDERKNYYNPFESEEEKEFFEKEIGRDLSLDYRREDCIWNTGPGNIGLKFSVDQKMKTIGYRFDLSKPYDALTYKVARMQRDVAPNLKTGMEKKHFVFYLSDGTEENKASTEKYNLNSKLYRFFGKIEESKDKMREFLELYYMTMKEPKDVPVNISESSLRNEIQNLIDVDPVKVGLVVEDEDKDMKIILIKALKAGAVEKTGVNSYSLPGGKKEGLEEFIGFMRLMEKKKDTDDTWGRILSRIEIFEEK